MDIYEPREDSFLLKGLIKRYAKGRILDMGTGSGILAEEARRYSDDVTGADINPDAIGLCRERVKGVRFVESDMFSALDGVFDLIIFNPPYLPQEKNHEDIALYGGKKGYETIVRFLDSSPAYISDEGSILLLFSELSHRRVIEKAISDNFMQWEEVARSQVFFETLYVYRIWKSPIRVNLEKVGISEIRFLAKGKRGVVYTGLLDGKKVTIKTKRPESDAIGRIENEAIWLPKLHKHGIGPGFVLSGDGFLVYGYVDGISFDDFIENNGNEAIRRIVSDIAEQARTLDIIGIDKEEMHRLTKNLLIGEKAVLIDFERCHFVKEPRNVTQFCQFMSSTRISGLLEKKGIIIDRDALVMASKAYKRSHSDEDFRILKNILKLD